MPAKKQKIQVSPDLRLLLRSAGYKVTPARQAILEALRKAGRPISIDKIMSRLESATIDKATAYRALALLEKIGLARKVDLRHGHADYEFAAEGHHHHLVCLSCGKLEDLEDCEMKEATRKALNQSRQFASIENHSMEFFGMCKECAAAKQRKDK